MKLLNPNLGEAIDRLTILTRKIVEGKQLGKRTDHFNSEALHLYDHVQKMGVPTGFLPQILYLAALNAAIWDATAWMNSSVATDNEKAIAVNGKAIFLWNNDRAALVAALGLASGEVEAEKLYDLGEKIVNALKNEDVPF